MRDVASREDRDVPGRIATALWLAQPAYLLVEALVATATREPYSYVHRTISDLGAVTCPPPGAAAVCSPAHPMMNMAFVFFGLALAVGAVLLYRSCARTRLTTVAFALWVVAGASSVAVGLVPLDAHPTLHGVVATPVFIAQPVALILHGMAVRRTRVRLRWLLCAAGALTFAAAVAFVARPDMHWVGLLERLSLWPVKLLLPVLAIALLRAPDPTG